MTSPSSPTRLAPALVGAVAVGILTAVQARINGQLGVRLEHAMAAAVISFGSGLLLVALVSLLTPAGRRGARALSRGIRERSIPWWMLLGGAAGALTVGTQSVAVGIVGVSLYTVGSVAGQTAGGLILDRWGYGPGGAIAVTVPRLVGGALALTAVGVVLFSGDGLAGVPVWMVLLPVLVGAGLAWQQATNGRLRARVGTPVTATLVNFALGTAILGVLALVVTIVDGPPQQLPTEPWIYLGGALGVAYIMLSAALVSRTGVLLFGLAAVSGQLLASLALDVLWPAPAGPGMLIEAVAVVVGLASVLVASLWRGGR